MSQILASSDKNFLQRFSPQTYIIHTFRNVFDILDYIVVYTSPVAKYPIGAFLYLYVPHMVAKDVSFWDSGVNSTL